MGTLNGLRFSNVFSPVGVSIELQLKKNSVNFSTRSNRRSLTNFSAEMIKVPRKPSQLLPQYFTKKSTQMTTDDLQAMMDSGLLPNCENLNVSLPPGITPETGKVVHLPVHGLFFNDAFNRICFQRTEELPKANTKHLVGLLWFCKLNASCQEYGKLIKMELDKRSHELQLPEFAQVKQEAFWE